MNNFQYPIIEKHGVSFIDFNPMNKDKWDQSLESALSEFKSGAVNIGLSKETESFDNTLGKLESLSSNLSIVSSGLYTVYAHATPEIQDLISKWSAILSGAFSDVYQNEDLLNKIQFAYSIEGDTWDQSQIKLYEDTLRSFKNSGSGMSIEDKAMVKNLKTELSKLDSKFDEINLSNSNVKIYVKSSNLIGGDAGVIKSCAHLNINGDDVANIPVSAPFIEPLLTGVVDRDTRHKLWKAWTSRGTGCSEGDISTKDIIEEILIKRTSLAKLLGFNTWSEYVLSSTMASNNDMVNAMLEDTLAKLLPNVEGELEQLQYFAQEKGLEGDLMPWDIDFYMTILKKEKFSIYQDEVEKYFPLDHVRSCAFASAQKVFGINFEKDLSIPTYHPDAVGYKVTRSVDGEEINVGIIIIDDFIRETKAPGAWMNAFASGHKMYTANLSGVINVLNIPKPSEGEQALLSFDDAVTIYHELGHAIHGLLGNTPYLSQSGTNVVRDFVELPSSIFENWFSDPKALKEVSCHIDTKQSMPQDMIDNLMAAFKFGQNFAKISYLLSALVDMRLHQKTVDSEFFTSSFGVANWEANIIEELKTPKALTQRHFASNFSHIFGGGYSSGYYSYLWAEVLEADIFSKFKENGLYHKESCDALSDLYKAGGSANAMDLFVEIMGREPSPNALLERFGVSVSPPKSKATI